MGVATLGPMVTDSTHEGRPFKLIWSQNGEIYNIVLHHEILKIS